VKTFQCNACHQQTTLTSGTIFHATKLSLRTWFKAMYFLTQSKNDVSALELKRLIGVCYRTAWRIEHKVLQVMTEREAPRKLDGRVEVDDVYLGGELRGGKAGFGSESKVPLIAAVETNDSGQPRQVVFSPAETFSHAEGKDWAEQHLAPSATVVSYGLACFSAVTAVGCQHEPQVVGKQRKSTDMSCFHWINTILGNLKTSISGTYHAFKFGKYADRYLSETQYRFNRRFNLRTILPRLILAAVTTGKGTEVWLRLAEAQR
jgi:hypothetical protein